jgi:EmrB/QacA subfamily drug resistance transporter
MEDYTLPDKNAQNRLIAIICAGTFIANLDATIVNITLPTLSEEFSVSPSVVSWAILAYLLCETGFMLPFGKLADITGIKRVYLTGFIVFLIGSLLCGISTGMGELIAFRALQGVGGAMLFTVMLAFIPIYIPLERRVAAMGVVTTAAAAGVALGPPLGGWITTFIGWRWIFFVNLPFCLAAIFAVKRYIPAASPRATDRRFDFAGSIYSFSALVFFLYGVSMGREHGWNSPTIIACFLIAGLSAMAFIRQEKKIPYPLLNLAVLRDKVMLFGTLSLSASLMTVGGVLFIFPFYLEEYRNLDTHVAGMIMMLLSFGQFIGPYMGGISQKFGIVRICLAGLLLGFLSFLLFIGLDPMTKLLFIVFYLGLFGLSQGIGKAPNAALVMACAPPDCRGAVSSILNLCRSLSIALGVLFFETIFSDSIPHHISVENKHIGAGISHASELAPGFFNTFLFGTFVSLAAILLMLKVGREKG